MPRRRAPGAAGADLGDDEVAQVLQDVAGDVRQVEPLLREPLDDREARGRVARDERRRQLVEDLAVGDAEHARHVVARQLQAAERDDLIEEAHRVAHRARRFAREDLHGRRRRP